MTSPLHYSAPASVTSAFLGATQTDEHLPVIDGVTRYPLRRRPYRDGQPTYCDLYRVPHDSEGMHRSGMNGYRLVGVGSWRYVAPWSEVREDVASLKLASDEGDRGFCLEWC